MAVKFYEILPEMECLQGDTLPAFLIEAEGTDPDMHMYLILASQYKPQMTVVRKECTATGNGFQVQLTSEETKTLRGTYQLHFCLSANGLKYKKIAGILNVIPVAEGG